VTVYTYHTVTLTGKKIAVPHIVAVPRYLPNPSKMRTDIVAAHGQLNSFGMDFAEKLLSHHSSIWVAIPYLLLVAAAVGLQYLQMSRLNARNPQASQANPQAAMMQKYMPLIFGFIYLNVAAILNVYFIISSAIRILTQEILFRKGLVAGPAAPIPGRAVETKKGSVADRTEKALPKPKGTAAARPAKPASGNGAGTTAGRAAAADKAPTPTKATPTNGSKPAGSSKSTNGTNGKPVSNGNGSNRPAARSGPSASNGVKGPRSRATPPAAGKGAGTNGSNGTGATGGDGAGSPKEHPRSKTKRERKAR
jgi:hypothetical protein